MATGPFNGTITYTTTKDINKIIITGIPTNKVTEGEPIKIAGTVKITTGTVEYINGKARVTKGTPPTATAQIATATKATITPNKDGKTATLKIDIEITEPASPEAALDALADLAIPVKGCTVNVDTNKNNLTIKITYDQKDKYAGGKYTDIEITDITGSALTTLGLTTTNAATVRVDPAPNHLTIKYGSKEISAAVPKPKNMAEKGMTEITTANAQNIVKELKQTLPPNDTT
ncbi:uncharacterized protein TA09260 [Theileria annulata]|uniref:Uncharacterized protein n=1 Tax=Theileria annulata TaxID=5874 RepID=Q4UAF5_THEAN|nr:uncharacterized protein TA09260 [Theileria annulata]CAI76196.1 hypothetical protein TA09260 [Theileria annulata]|eukprot:XP_952821.1 hypothetical protein TA09260 [Theileria annulata]